MAWGFANSLVAQAATSRLLFAMARDRQLPSFLAKVHPTRRVPVNATLLTAAYPLALGLYMTSRADGITLLSSLVNFGALSTFLVLHVAVVVHYLVRKRSRDYWRHLVAPVLGFAILAYVVVNANIAAQRLGFVWVLVGALVLTGLIATGRKPQLSVAEPIAAVPAQAPAPAPAPAEAPAPADSPTDSPAKENP